MRFSEEKNKKKKSRVEGTNEKGEMGEEQERKGVGFLGALNYATRPLFLRQKKRYYIANIIRGKRQEKTEMR